MCCGARREMVDIHSHYFNVNRILLLAVGLWPYQQSKLVRLQIIVFFGVLTSIIVFQLTTFVTTECTPDFVTKVLSSVLLFCIYIINYNSFFVNSHNVKCLFEQLQSIRNELRNENEIAIIENYWCKAKHYTTRLTLYAMVCIFVITIQSVWRRIFCAFIFVNESRSYRTIQIVTEYFVDQEKHYYLILLHTNVAFSLGVTVMIATGTMLILFLKHACGMFRVASYRIEQAMEINILQTVNMKDETMIYKEICYAVHIHNKAIKFSKFLVSSFEGSFLFVIACCVICLSLNLFRISQVIFEGDIEELFLHLAYIVSLLIYMFLVNYAAQEVTDHNSHVFATAYNVQWYIAPLHVQKMILFLLQRSTKTLNLNLGGLFVASLENFSSLISASMSYFTVLYSTRQ